MNVHNIIAQHRNSVALLFYRYGYSGEVNPQTLKAMAVLNGRRFVNELHRQIRSEYVHYAAPVEIGIVPGFEGSNIGVTTKGLDAAGNYLGMNPGYKDVMVETPPIALNNPILPVYQSQIDNGDLPPVIMNPPALPDMTAFTPPEETKITMESTTQTPPFVAQPTAAEKKSWFEKNQKLVIGAAIFIVVLALVLRRPATVIK